MSDSLPDGGFRAFAATCRRSPLMRALNDCAADLESARVLLQHAPPTERRPVLLWAAVHDLVLAGAEHPLAEWYPTVGGHRTDVERIGPALASFLDAESTSLAELIATRVVQTNEVGRAAALVPALAWIRARLNGERLHLLEVGASAGLNLLADRFRIELGDVRFGAPDAPVVVRAELRGDPPRSGPATIDERVGLDRSPVDLRDERARRWLRACVWADDLGRFARLSDAIALAAADPPRVEGGDAVADLERCVPLLPADGHLVIFHSWLLGYLAPNERRSFVDAVTRIAERRPVTWLAMELRDEVPELPEPGEPRHRLGATELLAISPRPGRAGVTRLAELHPHGTWVDWSVSRRR